MHLLDLEAISKDASYGNVQNSLQNRTSQLKKLMRKKINLQQQQTFAHFLENKNVWLCMAVHAFSRL